MAPRSELTLAQRRLAVGLGAAGGVRDDALGALTSVVVTASARYRLACAGRLCAAARAEAGVAIVDARPSRERVAASSLTAPFLFGGAELSLAAGPFSLELAAGWSSGAVALVDDRAALRLAGPLVSLAVGARLAP